MSDIFEEVEEEVRKDRLGQLWRRFGWIVWLLAIALVGTVAVSEFLSAREVRMQEQRIVALEAALNALEMQDYARARQGLSDIVAGEGRLAPLAAHYLAAAHLTGGGDRSAAIEALSTASDGGGAAFERLALLKAAYLESDALTRAELEDRLAPLLAEDTPLGVLAQELLAVKAYAEGDYETARREFNRLRFSANAPQGLVQRATIALDAIPRPAPAAEDIVPAEPGDGDMTSDEDQP